jgi:hypothetical protein
MRPPRVARRLIVAKGAALSSDPRALIWCFSLPGGGGLGSSQKGNLRTGSGLFGSSSVQGCRPPQVRTVLRVLRAMKKGRLETGGPKQGFIDCPTDASGMRRQLSPAADIASDRLW